MTRSRPHVWYDAAWPVAAGLVTGCGLLAAYRWAGPPTFLAAFALLEATVAPVAWALFVDLGLDVRRVLFRVAPATAATALAVMGLADAIGGWTFLVVAAVVLTSPALEGCGGHARGRVLTRHLSPRAETRRRFDEIVAHGFGTPEENLPPHWPTGSE